ncbi:hypothetical protein GQ607_000727 [Colletotrichum asianum]|uniref:Transmembrane protein n=1 Tax=Colletotrichum asianum TaxID=702518 RepID=A0A8H3ZY23_9PEZI|nr:hypothetical protein GQ607_000727 [Colletotrichum asianum]
MALGPSDSSIISPSHPGRATRTFLATPSHDCQNPCLVFPRLQLWAVPGRLLPRERETAAARGVGRSQTRYHSPLFLSPLLLSHLLGVSLLFSLSLFSSSAVCAFFALSRWNCYSSSGTLNPAKEKTRVVHRKPFFDSVTRQHTRRMPTYVPSLPPLSSPTNQTDRHERQ